MMIRKVIAKVNRLIVRLAMPVLDNPGLFVTVVFLLGISLVNRFFFTIGAIDFLCRGLLTGPARISLLPVIFIVAYTLCLTKQYLKIGKCFVPIIALLVACDMFLAINFGMGINQVSVQLFLQTNASESREFLSSYVFTLPNLMCFSAILLVCLIGLSGKFEVWLKGLLAKRKCAFAYLVLACLTLPTYVFRAQVLGVARLMRVNDTYALYRLADFVPDDVLTKTLYSFKSVMATSKDIDMLVSVTRNAQVDSCTYSSPNVVVIIGESFNKHHSNLYGYKLNTNPHLQERMKRGELFVFTNAVTPFNSTGSAMKYMLSSARARNGINWAEKPLYPTVFKKAGYNVIWMDNQMVPKTDYDPWDYLSSYFIYEPTVVAESFDSNNLRIFRYDGQFVDSLMGGGVNC